MRFGIRLRFAVWLLAALLPVGAAAVVVFGRMEAEVSQRVASDLESVRDLEASRIADVFDRFHDGARRLARNAYTASPAAAVNDAQTGVDLAGRVETLGMGTVGPSGELPLQPLADSLIADGEAVMYHVVAIRIVDLDGSVLGETTGFGSTPVDPDDLQRTMEIDGAVMVSADRTERMPGRVRVIAPVRDRIGATVGLLVVENDLAPVADLVRTHNSTTSGSEAFLVQPLADGDARVLSSMDGPSGAEPEFGPATGFDLPIEAALSSPQGQVLRFEDPTGHRSIMAVETLDEVGWGLIVRVDRDAALDPILRHTTALKVVALLGVIVVLVGWASLLDPVARRLRRLAAGAERVANGDYATPLDDRSSDEIGSVAKSIDRLATDLATDIAVRTDVEDRLRYQATHDATTGLYNRQYATTLMKELVKDTPADAASTAFSLLFLDLDRFKSINDRFGHVVGDSVLSAAGRRLLDVAGGHGVVARWGGDEFVVILPGVGAIGATAMAANVERAFSRPIDVDGIFHGVRASIGSATHEAGVTVGEVLQTADAAMFVDKQIRRGSRSRLADVVQAVEFAM